MYSLYIYTKPYQQLFYTSRYLQNTSKSDEYRRECSKYTVGLTPYEALIQIPPEYDINPLPNLGPKVNHHFTESNSVYSTIEHPRWGLIQSVKLTRDIKAGEELFTDYGYGHSPFPTDFPWYWETKLALDKEERMQKEVKKNKSNKKTKKSKKVA